MRQAITISILLAFSQIIFAQTYVASGWTGFATAVNGSYTSTGMQSDGVDYYKHATSEVYIFRVDAPPKSWVIADAPNLVANIIYDVITSSSATPPVAGWNFGGLALPVELIAFEVKLKNGLPHLTWTTANELNNKGFEVEQSLDGINFKNIGFINGNGTTQEIQNYRFEDNKPSMGINYYRLKQIDLNGDFEYSDIVSLEVKEKAPTIKIFPNPVIHEQFQVSLGQVDTFPVTIQLFNMNGQLIKEEELMETLNNITLMEEVGIYMLQLKSKTWTKQLKIVKL
jgi:hypothetical protein